MLEMRREAEEYAVLHLKVVLAPILEVAGGRLNHLESRPVQILIVTRRELCQEMSAGNSSTADFHCKI